MKKFFLKLLLFATIHNCTLWGAAYQPLDNQPALPDVVVIIQPNGDVPAQAAAPQQTMPPVAQRAVVQQPIPIQAQMQNSINSMICCALGCGGAGALVMFVRAFSGH